MSNDLTLSLSNDLPDYLKEVGLDDMTKALAGNTGTKRISIRGGVFRMMVNGEEIAKNENRAMNIVIVNGAAKVARSFYAGKYVAGEASHPDCWSNDGDKPDASIEHPQASTCEGCPTLKALAKAIHALAATNSVLQLCWLMMLKAMCSSWCCPPNQSLVAVTTTKCLSNNTLSMLAHKARA